jgi:hypothetical protein
VQSGVGVTQKLWPKNSKSNFNRHLILHRHSFGIPPWLMRILATTMTSLLGLLRQLTSTTHSWIHGHLLKNKIVLHQIPSGIVLIHQTAHLVGTITSRSSRAMAPGMRLTKMTTDIMMLEQNVKMMPQEFQTVHLVQTIHGCGGQLIIICWHLLR